jgi:FG-GAP-like repeat
MKMRLQAYVCLAIAGLTFFAALPAHAGQILYSISSEDNLLRVVDPSTGDTISSVPITLAGRTVKVGNGLATHPVTRKLFALLTLDGQPGRQLVTINPATGVATSIGNTGDQFAGLAFNSSGTLFTVVGDKKNFSGGAPPETLFTLNTSNAIPSQMLILARGNDGEAIGFNPNDGLLYHASGNDTGGNGCQPLDSSICVEIFESINPNTLAVTNIPISGNYTPFSDNYFEAAALTHVSGNVLLLADINQNLYKITTAGVVTFVGSMDHVSKGLAFIAKSSGDFDADGKADIGIYRSGSWHVLRSSDGLVLLVGWGIAADIPVPADYDGDGKTDLAIYRNGDWFIHRSSDGGVRTVGWGIAQDIPVPADYDGDGKADIAVYRDGNWFILRSSDGGVGTVGWGIAQDIPVPADYDGDGKADIAVYRDGNWFILRSSDGGVRTVGWGIAQDIPVPRDYDGDGKTDIAVYRNGGWFIHRSSDGGVTIVSWGIAQDIPVPADYDGDGKVDIAVYRVGTWYILRSSDGVQIAVGWGAIGDIPVN